MQAPQTLELWSSDSRLGVQIPFDLLQTALKHCQVADCVETGGVIVGRYSTDHRCAVITKMSGPPQDSRQSLTRFIRGILGMQNWINRLWSQHGEYYLGEWHYHPYSPPKPSNIDIVGLKSIAESEQYSCPEPILLIVGGNPHGEWSARMFVWVEHNGLIELLVAPSP